MDGAGDRRARRGRFGYRFRNGDFRDADADFLGAELERDRAELDDLARTDLLVGDGFVVDEGAVGRLKVADDHTAFVDADLGVKGGDGSLMDDDVVGGVATHRIQASMEVEPVRQQESTEVIEVHGTLPAAAGVVGVL